MNEGFLRVYVLERDQAGFCSERFVVETAKLLIGTAVNTMKKIEI